MKDLKKLSYSQLEDYLVEIKNERLDTENLLIQKEIEREISRRDFEAMQESL